MADLVNTGGFRSSLAASSPSLPKLDQIDYDTINKAFAQGWDEGKKLLADLDEFEVRPAKKELQKQALEIQGLQATTAKKVLSGEQPRFRNDGNFVIDDLTGSAQAAPRPSVESVNLYRNDRALVQRRYSTDPYTGARTQIDEIEVMPAPKASEAPAASEDQSSVDPFSFEKYGAGSPAAGTGSVETPGTTLLAPTGVGKSGITLGRARAPRAASSTSAGSPDNYLKAADNDRMKEFATKADQAAILKAEMEDFARINATTYTGAASRIPGVNFIRSLANSDVATLDAYNLNFAKLAREGFAGAVSNKEMAMYKNSVPGSGNPPETNVALIAAMLPAVDRANERNSVAREWVDRHGSLTGFETEWARYLEDVPVVDRSTLDKAKTNPKEALAELGNRPPTPDFKEYLAFRRAGVIPESVVEDFSQKLQTLGKTRPELVDTPEKAAAQLEQALVYKYPFLKKSAQERDALPSFEKNITDSLGRILGSGAQSPALLDEEVGKALSTPAPAPAPAPTPSGKKVGDVLKDDSDPARASRTLPRYVGSADQPLPSEIGGIFFAGEQSYPAWAEWLGAPAEPFVRGKQGAVSRMLGRQNNEPLTEDVDPKFIDWLAQNKEKVTSDPQFAAKVNQLVRAAVAQYDWKDISKEEWKKGRWFDSTTRRTLDPKATRRRRFALQSALFKAGLNGIVRLPAIPGDVDEAPIVDSGPAEPIDDLPVVPVDSVVASR